MLVDFHNHILPAVDDGARDPAEARAALLVMNGAGVSAIVATPHVRASSLRRASEAAEYRATIQQGFETVRQVAAIDTPGISIHLGAELLLDDADVSVADPLLRLAGTQFVLAEFSLFGTPPTAADMLFRLRAQGTRPILAHPERYPSVNIATLQQWRSSGTLLQVNAGSLLGDYGPDARRRAWALLEVGMVDYICGDYHARGKYRMPAAFDAIEMRIGRRQRDTLVSNGLRLSRGEEPRPVEPGSARRWFHRFIPRT